MRWTLFASHDEEDQLISLLSDIDLMVVKDCFLYKSKTEIKDYICPQEEIVYLNIFCMAQMFCNHFNLNF